LLRKQRKTLGVNFFAAPCMPEYRLSTSVNVTRCSRGRIGAATLALYIINTTRPSVQPLYSLRESIHQRHEEQRWLWRVYGSMRTGARNKFHRHIA